VSAEKAVTERNILPCLARNRTLLFNFLNPVDVRKINGACTRKYRGAGNCEIAGKIYLQLLLSGSRVQLVRMM
jgi:hypothetical protein